MSSEVSSGHVSIFPVMTGFKARVAKETKAAGAAGAKSFEGGFKGAGSATGRTLGRGLKSALSNAAGDLGAAELRKLTGDVASASAALAKARLRQQDDAGRVRVAETRLTEAIARSGEASAQAVAAEERLASARRVHGAITDQVTAATSRLRSAQDALRTAQEATAVSSVAAAGGIRQLLNNFRAGFTDANAARSAFSGVAGSVGGILRAVSDLTGLTAIGHLGRLAARQASTAFTSLATMVGGQLAKAWGATSRWLGTVGSAIRAGLAPVARVAMAAGTAIATPFVQLGGKVATWMRPVTSQVSAAFQKVVATAGPAASRLVSSFRSGLSGLGSAASSAFQSVVGAARNAASTAGAALGSGIQSAATGAVTIAAAGIAVSLGKGFARLNAIDTARAKLTGLGNDATAVDAIMGDALASVRGTSFGLGEAATVAAGAVAAGIRPGEALQGTLKGIANVASAAGISMEESGAIFNKVAATGRAYTENLNQLADRGVPIWQALATRLGVTTDEVRKMATEGKIDFATFSAAAADAAGTVATEMGKTVPGAARNFLASMGRIGANALQPVYGKIAPLIAAATSALGPIEERAKAFGEVLLRVVGPAMDWVTNLFTRIGEGASLADAGLGGLAAIIAPLGAAFAAIGAGGLAGLLARLGPLGAMLPGLSGALGLLASPLGIVAAAFGAFALSGGDASSLVAGLTGVVSSVVSALPGMVSQIAEFVPQLVGSLLDQVPALLSAGARIVTVLVQGLVTAIPALASGALSLVQGLISAIVAALPQIITGAIMLVGALIEGIITALPLLVTAAVQLVTGLLTAIVAALPVIIEGGIQLLMALILGIVQALPMLLQAALDLVTGLLTAIVANLPMIIEAGVQLLLSLMTGLIAALPQLITAAINLVIQLILALLQMLPQLIEAGIQLVVALILGLVQAIPQIIAMIPQIIEAIWNGLAGVDWLSLGAQIIQGVIDGFFSMVGAVGDAIGSVVGGILDFFPHSPAKRGPLSGAGWSRLKSSGGAMLDQFSAGADENTSGLGDSLATMAADASKRAQAAMSNVTATVGVAEAGTAASGAAGAAGTPGTGAGAGSGFTQINNFEHMDPEVAIEAAGQRAAAAAARIGGA